ncbi:MAG: hypothetical protein J7K34_09420 [Flavobacteriaceae bacterium]|nr:hypothetical protein [Flavobacteriaceae bacterium]
MTKILKKYDYLLPLIAAVLFFLTQRDTFPTLVYTIFIVLMGVYFFPLKDIVLGNNLQLKEKNIDFLGLFANFILMALLAMSVYLLFFDSNESIQWLIRILFFINFSFLVYFYMKDDDTKRSIVHLCFIFFATIL